MATQPKNYGFGEDEVMLRDSARKFLRDNCPADKLHALVASDPSIKRSREAAWDKEAWQQMVELGWTAVAVPESAGGLGMPTVAAIALAEEVGRVAFPSPLIATFNATYVLAACSTDAANTALGQIAEGKSATLAITNAAGSWESADTDVSAEGDALSGTACFVQEAQKVDFFVVSAKTASGVALYVIDATAEGVSIAPDAIVDLTRDQARVSFSSAKAQLVSDDAVSAIDAAKPAIHCTIAADMCGAGQWQLETTTEYACVREQFGHPIGFFQAVKHPIVNMMIDIDRAKGLVYNAACAIDSEPEEAAKLAHMAKSSASDTAAFCSNRSVQLHGGIGFTWESFIHLFFKRQHHNQVLFGDGKYHRAKLADLVIGPIGG